MHPDLIRALAKARHDDLLAARRPRRQPTPRLDRTRPRFHRSRRKVGSLLIWAGARLAGVQRPAVELASVELAPK